MKKSEPRRSTIRRLLTLLIIVLVGVGSAANQVDGASLRNNPLNNVKVDLFDHFFNQNNSDIVETGTQIRRHLLYNLCSERLVKIIRKNRKGINARGKKKGKNMKFSKLIFESTPSGTIKIYGEHTGLHLCYSRRGKLRAQRKSKSLRCQFREEYSEDNKYTHYKTADATKDWYLGFKKNGKPLKGTDINKYNVRNQDCFKFQKLHPNRTSEKPNCPGNGDGPEKVNFCDNNILKLFKQHSGVPPRKRIRHDSKHNKRRGKG